MALPSITRLKEKLGFWKHLGLQQKLSLIFFVLILILLPVSVVASLTATRTRSRAELPATPPVTETCPSSHPSSDLFYGDVFIDGLPAPVGAKIRMYSPRGELVGCQNVGSVAGAPPSQPGIMPFTYVYGSEAGFFSGMESGEPITFKVNGYVAQTEPSPVIFNQSPEYVKLFVNTASPTPTPTAAPVCQKGVISFSVDIPCGVDFFQNASFTCQDQFSSQLANCQTINASYNQANQICQGRGCIPLVTPTLAPTPTSTPIPPTPTPTLTQCEKDGGVCCTGSFSFCTGRRNVYQYGSDSYGCNPTLEYPGIWCCDSCSE